MSKKVESNVSSSIIWKNKLMETRRHFRDPILITTIILVLLSLVLFILAPLYNVLKQSLIDLDGNLSLSGYIRAFSYSDNITAISHTMILATVVGVLGTFIGFVFAYCSAYIKMRAKKAFNLIAMLPIVSPPFAVALSIILLFGSRGLITHDLLGIDNFNIYGFKGLVFVQTLSYFPIAYLLLNGLLKSIDPSIEEASRNLGASRGATFCNVTLPLIKPGLANAFLLVFIKSVADFANPITIGGDYTTLATQVYLQAIGNYDMQGGAAIAVILLNISILLFILQKYYIEKKVFVTITGKASKERVLISEKHIVYPLAIFSLGISIIIIMFYALIPLESFVKLWGIDYSLTLNNYKYAFDVGAKAILDTTWLSIIATPFTGLIGMVIAFLIVRKKFIGKGLIEFISMLGMAVPGTVIGIGYILTFNNKPFVLTGTAAIIVIAYISRSIPVGIRSGVTALQQIDPSIEEAASDLGANSAKVFTSISLPLIKTSFFGGLVYSFVKSMTSISAIIFLVSAKYNILTISILDQIESGKFGVAAAFSTVLIVIVYIVIGIMYKLIGLMGASKDDIRL
ncbi:ABC transporter permease [Tepidibacter hydrothermalis]|uniref:Iron ABC transporter permease n=1 Tax=Tepidibacter hydrothermalis TaxID=3036126 RepID=A0ABY8ECZ9_9FIRM|nr:iron ABC transporter permease [Tepidibacter hydrothermalis]WFD09372.1 iron ABC transporter permease [Tepidibacter hydrothermalis]